MTRIALGIEYDGSGFSGWQSQRHAASVQGELQRAVSRVADHDVVLTAAGRTDAGVHALSQVAHFDSDAVRPLEAWVLGTNSEVAPAISVLWARSVPAGFHARYSAVARSYVYRILNRRTRPALARGRICWIRRPLDASEMNVAARVLIGEHDFSGFRAAECQSSTPVRRVDRIVVERDGALIAITVRANAFLHHMVRNIAGSLIAVGTGDRPASWIGEVLASRDRGRGGVTAPPDGLYFAGVEYPVHFGLPSAASASADACPYASADV